MPLYKVVLKLIFFLLLAFRKPPPIKNKAALSPPGPALRTPQPGIICSMQCNLSPHCHFHSDSDKAPLLPARHKSPASLKSKNFSRDLENAVAKSKASPIVASPTTTPGSLETTISQLSDRLRAVEEQLSLVTADVETLKAKNGMDSDYSILQPMQLLTRDDVSH